MRETLFQICIMNICMIQIWRINTSNYIERKWIHTDVWRNYSQITTKKCRKVKVLVTQLCSTLCDPMSLPGSSVHGILQARYWSELLFPPPGNLPGSGIEPRSPVLQADCLLSEPPEKPQKTNKQKPNKKFYKSLKEKPPNKYGQRMKADSA